MERPYHSYLLQETKFHQTDGHPPPTPTSSMFGSDGPRKQKFRCCCARRAPTTVHRFSPLLVEDTTKAHRGARLYAKCVFVSSRRERGKDVRTRERECVCVCVCERECENGARNVYISTCGNVGYNGIQEDGGRMKEGLEKAKEGLEKN